ncbi:membrane-bound serine protease (ClpP class) [Melghirimyces profundicolus]|uniref:Membrane-bound serine protease (ClpP class) n=1 Tax=Melghirimyces profundicolus TaxID=1242148 RepID=A0A2T6C963_9BACL|nr:NfeD family protein [Melghirimyces profundicolus]PTX64860.1 membrane-bound serine protease (ClpP class) [Melghirimyces profundicolus]
MKRLVSGVLLFLSVFTFAVAAPGVGAEDTGGRPVYWVPLEQNVERGLARFLDRAFREADQVGAKAVVLKMDTLGGDVGAALEIGKRIRASQIPVTVYIKGEAISAGAYIALNADHILMTPGSAIGAAEPRTLDGRTADPKTVAFWESNMRAAAESQGRDPEIAAGMVDRNLVIEGVKEKGELISLSARQAVKQDLADRIVSGEKEVYRFLNVSASDIVRVELTPSERLARFVTSPYVIPILFMIGLAGIAIEVFTPGFGFPGVIGLGAFGLYFFGHYLAGFAGAETFVLLAAGLILLIIEIFVPGFGIFGILGLLSLAAAVVTAASDRMFSLASFLIAMGGTAVGMWLAVRYFGARGFWNRLVLSSEQNNQTGYVSRTQQPELVGKRGKSLTPLRPAGAAIVGGVRRDVVSEGGFIPAGTPVEVVEVRGGRVVVRTVEPAPGENRDQPEV